MSGQFSVAARRLIKSATQNALRTSGNKVAQRPLISRVATPLVSQYSIRTAFANSGIQTPWAKRSVNGRNFASGIHRPVKQEIATFEKPNILAGGTGDVSSRAIRYALENPKANVYILHIKGTNVPFDGLPPKNVHIIDVTDVEGSPYTKPEVIAKVIRKYGINEYFPGWGNLSENPVALKEVKEALGSKGRVIGPDFDFIAGVGHKGNAIKLAKQADVPTCPGPEGLVSKENYDEKMAFFDKDTKIMFKAPESGGGYGMRTAIVGENDNDMFVQACAEGKCEALVAELFVVDEFQHEEIQSFGFQESKNLDPETYALKLSRNCSVQFKNAKWFQFSDPNNKPPEVQQAMASYAEKIGSAAKQRGPATHEFLLVIKDDTKENLAYLKDKYKVDDTKLITVGGKIYLILYNETNPRLQVEHPVTEGAYRDFDLDIFNLSRRIAFTHQLLDEPQLTAQEVDQLKSNLSELKQELSELRNANPKDLQESIQLRVYAIGNKQYDPVSGLKIELGSTADSATTLLGSMPSGVFIEGTKNRPPQGQDPLFAKFNAVGKDCTSRVLSALENLDTGLVQTNAGLLRATLVQDYKEFSVQRLSQLLKEPSFINESNQTTFAEDVHSGIKALAFAHQHGLKALRPGANKPPLAVISEVPEIDFKGSELVEHFGSVFNRIVEENPDISSSDQRRLATLEIVAKIHDRYGVGQRHIGFIDTRKRDTPQSIRQNNLPKELLPVYREFHNRMPYLALETTMGGNDQAKRGGEFKSENQFFNDERSDVHLEAGLVRGEIQVKLGDKAASLEERRAYIQNKLQDSGPLLAQIFSPFHNVEDWVGEAKLWAEAGCPIVIYPPEHAEEMTAKDLWDKFYQPCLSAAEKEGFLDQIAFLGLKDTGSATTVSRVRKELAELPKFAKEAGYAQLPWAHHTHDIGQAVAVSTELANVGFSIFWTSPDTHAGDGANVPEGAFYNALIDQEFTVDFNPKLAQQVAKADEIAKKLGAPYEADKVFTSTDIVKAYLAPGALSHTMKALVETFPKQDLTPIIDDFVHAHEALFKKVLLLAPLTPHPNKVSNTCLQLVELAQKERCRINEMSDDQFFKFCEKNLSKLPELIKYLSGRHYPAWAQYDTVKERFASMVEKANDEYENLRLSNEDMAWVDKLEVTQKEFLLRNIHFSEDQLVDAAYHGMAKSTALNDMGINPNGVAMLREGDLQKISQNASPEGVSVKLMTENGTIPAVFMSMKRNVKTVDYFVRLMGPSGPIIQVTVPAKQVVGSGSAKAQKFGIQSDGYYVGEGKKGEIQQFFIAKGLVFSDEKVALINENKSIFPIISPRIALFTPMVQDTVTSGKTTVLESGTQSFKLEDVSFSQKIQDQLCILHQFRTSPKEAKKALDKLGGFDDEIYTLYPTRNVSKKEKEQTLNILNDIKGLEKVVEMFESKLVVFE